MGQLRNEMIFALALVIVSLGTLGQVVFGFGGGLIAIPPLSLLVGVQDAVTLALVLQLVTGLLVWELRAELKWTVLRPLLAGLIAAMAAGTYLLASVPENILRLFLAGFIVVYLIKSQFFDDLAFPGLRRTGGGLLTGLVAGLLQGLIGSGGPPLVIYLRETVRDKSAMRASLLLLLFLSNCLRLPLSISGGLFNSAVVTTSIAALPCFVVAMLAGRQWHRAMSEKRYLAAIRLVLAMSAFSLILKSCQLL